MRVWLDDAREMPKGFDLHVRTAEEAIQILKSGKVTFISLDHDLSFEHYLGEESDVPTGYDVAQFIECAVHNDWIPMPNWAVHSANPVGAQRIKHAMVSAERIQEKKNRERG